jgi:hypothetical protein
MDSCDKYGFLDTELNGYDSEKNTPTMPKGRNL